MQKPSRKFELLNMVNKTYALRLPNLRVLLDNFLFFSCLVLLKKQMFVAVVDEVSFKETDVIHNA